MLRPHAKYSLATLALVVAIVAGLLAGFRAGYDSAVSYVDSATVYVERYPVEDLVTAWTFSENDVPHIDGDTLVELVKTTVFPMDWQRPNAIYLDTSRRELVVTFQKAGHTEVTTLLEKIRGLRTRYDQFVNAGKCGHCGAAPLPQVGNACIRCKVRRAMPTSRPPSRITAYR